MGDPNIVLQAGHHFMDHVLQGVPNATANLLGRGVDRAVDRVFGRRLDDKIASVETTVARIETTLKVAAAQLARVAEKVDNHERLLLESREPATYVFVASCIEAAIQSPDHAKQCLLGDLIAARLVMSTESFEELQLRQAQRIVRDCTSVHLMALARLLIVTSPPFSFEQPVPFLEVKRFFDAVDIGTSNVSITYSDMRYILSVGAVTEIERDEINGHSSPWINRFMHWGYGVYDSDILQFENRVQQIAENRTKDGIEYAEGVALGKFDLTPPGYAIAARVASRIAEIPMESDYV